MQAAGRTIHDLSGEPDFPTDPHVAEADGRYCQSFTKYTATDGDGRTKQGFESASALGHRHYDDAEIVIGNGGMAVLGHIGMTLLDAGDEVIVRLLVVMQVWSICCRPRRDLCLVQQPSGSTAASRATSHCRIEPDASSCVR